MQHSAAWWLGCVALAASLAAPCRAAPPPLSRSLATYCLFASEQIQLKNVTVSGACNTGVDCAQPSSNSSCGTALFENAFFDDNDQLAADLVRLNPGARVWQLFRNLGPPLVGVTIGLPGPNPDGTFPLSPLPILGDVDGDGTPSCKTVGQSCVVDSGDLAAACGFPAAFPACTPGGVVRARSGADCIGAPDALPNNGRCDLGPGSYGDVVVDDGADLTLGAGDIAVCTFTAGRNSSVLVPGVTNLFVSGELNVGNGARLGQQCGNLTLLANGAGGFAFGRGATVVAKACAPDRVLLLGSGSILQGLFAGRRIAGDHNVRVQPCGGVGGAPLCTCFDSFSPVVASVGDTITFASMCDLRAVIGVLICGVPAQILNQSQTSMQVTVPVGASGACPVQALSTAGTFTGSIELLVQ